MSFLRCAVLGTVALSSLSCASAATPSPALGRMGKSTSAKTEATKPSSTTVEGVGGAYTGHGAESISADRLARYAPTPLPAALSRRIQAMLDLRAPVAARISPDGKNLYFGWTVTGTWQVWRMDGARRFPVQLTGGEDGTRVVALTRDGQWLVVSRDRKGEENPGLYLLSTEGGPLKEIQHKPKVQTAFQLLSDDGKYLYYSANDRKADAYAIYKYTLATGETSLLFGEDGLWSAEDLSGSKVLLAKATGALTKEYFEFDEVQKKLEPLFGQNEKVEYEAHYGPSTGEIVLRTAKFGDVRRLYRVVEPKGGPLDEKAVRPVSPALAFDVASFFFDHGRTTLYYTVNEGGYTRAKAVDAKTFVEKKLPSFSGEDHVSFGAPSWDGRYVSIQVSSAQHPTVSSIWDWKENKLVPWFVPSTPEVDPRTFAVPTLEHYVARDGTKIPMFVRRPKPGACQEPCPVVVHFHGGPEGQSLAGMSTYGQVFVDAGFVWVEPNVRGSDGYGKAWLQADDGPKRLQVITDIEDAAHHVRTAFAVGGRAPKVGVFGGSYGGYSTLMAMTRFAGAFDAGVANVGMSNLLTFLRNTAPYRRALRISEYGEPEKDREALWELSPLNHIDKLQGPLMLIQGASDPRVPVGEAIQMVEALEQRGRKPKLVVFPDEGHGAQKRENKVLEIGHTLNFFQTHLKPTDNN